MSQEVNERSDSNRNWVFTEGQKNKVLRWHYKRQKNIFFLSKEIKENTDSANDQEYISYSQEGFRDSQLI